MVFMSTQRLIESAILIALLFLMVSCVSSGVDRGGFFSAHRSLNNTSYGYKIIDDPTGISPVPKIERFEVRAGDCSSNVNWSDCTNDRERSEIRTNNHSGENWYTWSLYFPEDFKTIDPVIVVAGQFLENRSNSPAFLFRVDEEGYSLFKIPMDYYYLIESEDLKGKWHKIEMHVNWSNSSDGFLKIWVNGVKKIDKKFETAAHQPVFFKYGIYRMNVSDYQDTYGTDIPTQVVYYANVRKAKTREGLSLSMN